VGFLYKKSSSGVKLKIMKKLIVFLFLVFVSIPFIAKADLTTDYNTQYNALQQQILNLQNQEQQAMQSQANQPIPISAMQGVMETIQAEYQNKIGAIKSQEQQLYTNYQNAIAEQVSQNTNNAIQQTNNSSCGANSHYNSIDGKCYCDIGYDSPGGNKCMTYAQTCQASLGTNSYADTTTGACHCNDGYQFNTSGTGCTAIQATATITPKPTNQEITPPVITQQTINQNSNPPPVKKIITEKTVQSTANVQNVLEQEPTKIVAQTQSQTKSKTSNNIFSNMWNFIKNIFK
jgi:hypothetical protein